MALVLLLIVCLGGVLLALSDAQNVLRDAARAAALTAAGQDGGARLDRDTAEGAAREVFDAGIAQVSDWLAGDPPLEVEVLNPPPGDCAPFAGGGRCYRRPAVHLHTHVTVRALLGAWGTVSFDLETVVVAGIGDPQALPTPGAAGTDVPVSTEVLGTTPMSTPTSPATATVAATPTATTTPVPTATATAEPTARPPATTPTATAVIELTRVSTPTPTLSSPLPTHSP
jgi:hypothetical protein